MLENFNLLQNLNILLSENMTPISPEEENIARIKTRIVDFIKDKYKINSYIPSPGIYRFLTNSENGFVEDGSHIDTALNQLVHEEYLSAQNQEGVVVLAKLFM
ncbi:hypothetical protein BEN44_19710 [Leptospira interrogans serovar Ricardi]|uniref:hypothetical protein n=1 Tax=Leptospira interrogans TaxID=173 RepID=UPI002158C52A|nr:hypothetical protein [Leptospira interrogans]MCR8640784.1 hypothetical protein [Leptospira interrogans serovar Ricardi]